MWSLLAHPELSLCVLSELRHYGYLAEDTGRGFCHYRSAASYAHRHAGHGYLDAADGKI